MLITGNLLTCDCHLSYLHHYLTRAPQKLTDSSLLSAVCATPPSLGNAPLAQLPVTELTCDPEQEYYYRYYIIRGILITRETASLIKKKIFTKVANSDFKVDL